MSSFIKFESATEKERIRQELRDARENLLKKAEFNANRRSEQDLSKKLRGDDQWMLPSVLNKITDKHKTSKKRKKEKKSKSKKKKKRKSSSSESDSSTEEEIVKKHKKKRKRRYSTSTDSDSSEEEDEWVEKAQPGKSEDKEEKKALERDDWMSGMFIPTYSKDKEAKSKRNEKKPDQEEYDPSKNVRELNPYWKNGGKGIPGFQKPGSDDESAGYSRTQTSTTASSGNWKKKSEIQAEVNEICSESSSEESEKEEEKPEQSSRTNDFLTDQQMNELGAKIIKAEIMGNTDLVDELRTKLEKARDVRNNLKSGVKDRQESTRKSNTEQEDVILTTTNAKGFTKPVGWGQDEDKWGGRKGRKQKKQKVQTHEAGERIRFFADDDRSLKDMFEAEKMGTSSESDKQFVNVASKFKNKNDDLEDIFSDEVRKKGDNGDEEERDRNRAIREHQSLAKMLENCDRCFDSKKMEKQLIVSMGDHVYLSIPPYEGLQPGHCVISPLQHVSCSVLADEDHWEEVENYKKSLVKMFRKQKKDCIFFETAINLYRKPHLTIHCVPSTEFELAPFYFKKAIQESEAEWAQNRQLVDLKKEGKSLRRAIPKGLPYFWVDFGDGQAFAHVIEDQERFPKNFAQEIIGGILNLDPYTWRKPRKEQHPINKVKQFADWWKPFDWTQ